MHPIPPPKGGCRISPEAGEQLQSPPLWEGFRWGFIEILIINAFHYTD